MGWAELRSLDCVFDFLLRMLHLSPNGLLVVSVSLNLDFNVLAGSSSPLDNRVRALLPLAQDFVAVWRELGSGAFALGGSVAALVWR